MPLLQIDNVLLTTEILTEFFCCNLQQCRGQCCIEGDAGAPVTQDEELTIQQHLLQLLPHLADDAQQIIQQQGIAYTDQEGDRVTSIVNGKDCVFTCHENGCCLCAIEKHTPQLQKPISCQLYPIREVKLRNGNIGLQYHQWHICRDARQYGQQQQIRLYQFLRKPLTRRFSKQWYQQLCETAEEYNKQK